MSSIEYIDLFMRVQNNKEAKYHLFTFDIVGSTKMSSEHLVEAESILQNIITDVYNILCQKEKAINKKILVFENSFIKDNDLVITGIHEFGLKIEPFKLGDMVGFTIYRNTLSREEIIAIFNMVKEQYKYEYELHYADGYYETNDYSDGSNKLFRGYCIDILSNIHKQSYVKKLKKQ